ncbi:MAG TPA: MFS transporter [Candidatus Tumulicola sp.]|nr:MFS transporter [Candidatus Tumulicola sp.]
MNEAAGRTKTNQLVLSVFWFAWEVHWAALLGATLQSEIARFVPETFFGRATAILGGVGALLSIVVQFGAGRASDVVRRRMPFIIVGTLLDIVALYAFAFAPSFGAVVASVAAVQIALNIAGGPYQALIPDRVQKSEQGRASAFMGLLRLAGTAGGLLLAKLVVRQPGPEVTQAMYGSSLLTLVTLLSITLLVALAITVFGVRERPADVPPPTPITAWWESAPSFIALIVSRTFVMAGLYLVLPFLGFYLRFALGVRQYQSTSLDILLLMVGCSLIGTVPAGFVGDRISKKSIIYIALFMLTLGALALVFTRSLGPIYAVAVFIGLGWGAFYSVDWALACNLLPPGRAGALMALWNLGSSAPQVAAPVIGGLLVDYVGAGPAGLSAGYRAVFGLIVVCVVVGAIALAFVREARAGMDKRTQVSRLEM